MIVRRAGDRYVVEQPGITSWHCFSAGPHYDPANLGFGPVVGVDEHLVAPGAGFDRHAHRGVRIVSWVLEGTLRHEDGDRDVRLVGPGELLEQDASAGLRHAETNPSGSVPLRFVQTTVLADAGAHVEVVREPARLAAALLHLFVARGAFDVDGVELVAGDSARAAGEVLTVAGTGELIVVRVEA